MDVNSIKTHPMTFYLPVPSDYISLRCAQTFNIWSNKREISICFEVVIKSSLKRWDVRSERMKRERNHFNAFPWCLWGCGVLSLAISAQLCLWSPTTEWHSSSLPPLFQQHRTLLGPRSAQTHASQPHGCVSTHSRKALKCWQCFYRWEAG